MQSSCPTAENDNTLLSSTERNSDASIEKIDVHVVILNNYLRRHHVAAFKAIEKRVRKLTVLLSVSMEPDRSWEAEWDGLNVIVQKNRMFTTKWKHSSGFSEDNFIHIPIDTNRQLASLKPDVILSYEMGMRTMLSCWYRLFRRDCRLVMVGNMSQHIESERGLLRRFFRWMLIRGVDWFSYNGPSCKRYLQDLGIDESRMVHFPYCIDRSVISETGPSVSLPDSPEPTTAFQTAAAAAKKMLYCGAISERKGILEFAGLARQWCDQNPQSAIDLEIAGAGHLAEDIVAKASGNFTVQLLGNCNFAQMRDAYKRADVCVYPTFADEWGLVPIEALASGVPVLGSIYAQSVEACVSEGSNGWLFATDDPDQTLMAIDRCMKTSSTTMTAMSANAKASVVHITPEYSANEICKLINTITNGEAAALSSSTNFNPSRSTT